MRNCNKLKSNHPARARSHLNFFAAGVLAAAVILLTGAGCRQKKSPPVYHRLRTQLITDLFQALQDNNPDAAVKAADRLAPLIDSDLFLELTAKREQARLIVREVNRRLEKGRPLQADAYLRKNPQLGNIAPEIAESLRLTVAALEAVKRRQAKRPFPDADTGMTTLANLIQNHKLLTESETFILWEGQEKKRVVDLKEAEIINQINALFLESTPNRAAEKERTSESVRDFAGKYSDNTTAQLYTALQSNDIDNLKTMLDRDMNHEKNRKACTLVAGLLWPLPGTKAEELLWEQMQTWQPRSPAGWRTKALLAAVNGAPEISMFSTQKMLSKGGAADPILINVLLEHEVLDQPRQYNARPWRTPLPQAHDILDIMTQLREEHTNNAQQP